MVVVVVMMNGDGDGDDCARQLEIEVNAMRRLRHAHIVRYLGTACCGPDNYILMELVIWYLEVELGPSTASTSMLFYVCAYVLPFLGLYWALVAVL